MIKEILISGVKDGQGGKITEANTNAAFVIARIIIIVCVLPKTGITKESPDEFLYIYILIPLPIFK